MWSELARHSVSRRPLQTVRNEVLRQGKQLFSFKFVSNGHAFERNWLSDVPSGEMAQQRQLSRTP